MMKQLILLFALCLIFACNNNNGPTQTISPDEKNMQMLKVFYKVYPTLLGLINSISGSGSNYFSNEIVYRVALLRDSLNSGLTTGHIHLPALQASVGASNALINQGFNRIGAATLPVDFDSINMKNMIFSLITMLNAIL